MNDATASTRVEAAARALAADLEFTVPVGFEGDDGWYVVAERAIAAGDAASSEERRSNVSPFGRVDGVRPATFSGPWPRLSA